MKRASDASKNSVDTSKRATIDCLLRKEASAYQENSSPSIIEPAFGPESFDTFTPFPRLPIELRLKIWDLARPEGRFLILETSKTGDGIYSKSTVPAMLHVNFEARVVALQWYMLAFATWEGPGRTFFDFETDGLWCKYTPHWRGAPGSEHREIWTNDTHKLIFEVEKRKIERVVWEVGTRHGNLDMLWNPFGGILRHFPKVQVIMLFGRNRDTSQTGVVLASSIGWHENQRDYRLPSILGIDRGKQIPYGPTPVARFAEWATSMESVPRKRNVKKVFRAIII